MSPFQSSSWQLSPLLLAFQLTLLLTVILLRDLPPAMAIFSITMLRYEALMIHADTYAQPITMAVSSISSCTALSPLSPISLTPTPLLALKLSPRFLDGGEILRANAAGTLFASLLGIDTALSLSPPFIPLPLLNTSITHQQFLV
jgi:hypothetical protein